MKILIVKTSSLGDIVHAFPALAYLREHYPDAVIDWVVEKPFSALVKAHPHVNSVITIDSKSWRKAFYRPSCWQSITKMAGQLRKESYDLLFDMQGNTKSAAITGLAKAKVKVGYGFKTVWEYPNLLTTHIKYDPPKEVNVREENLFLVKSYCKIESTAQEKPFKLILNEKESAGLSQFLENPLLKEGRKILVAPGSNWKNKQLSEKSMEDFLLQVQEKDPAVFLIVFGNDAERHMAAQIALKLKKCILVEKMPLPVLQNLMGFMDLVIAMDSLPLHLAATAGTATFGIFGPSEAEKFAPVGKMHVSIQGPCPYGRPFKRRCPILRTCPTGLCMKNLTGQQLFQRYDKIS